MSSFRKAKPKKDASAAFCESLVMDETSPEDYWRNSQSAEGVPPSPTNLNEPAQSSFLSFMMMSKVKMHLSKRAKKVRTRNRLTKLQTEFVKQIQLDDGAEPGSLEEAGEEREGSDAATTDGVGGGGGGGRGGNLGRASSVTSISSVSTRSSSRSVSTSTRGVSFVDGEEVRMYRSGSAPGIQDQNQKFDPIKHRLSVFRPRSHTHRAGLATSESIPELRKQISLPTPQPGKGVVKRGFSNLADSGSFRISEEFSAEMFVYRPQSIVSISNSLAARSVRALEGEDLEEGKEQAAAAAAAAGGAGQGGEEHTGAAETPEVSVPVVPPPPGAASAPSGHGAAEPKPSKRASRYLHMDSMQDVELMQCIGFGTFGQVRLATIKHSPTPLAVKVLPKDHVEDLLQEEHVCQEAGLLAQLDHPFINTMHAAFQDDESLYIVLELLHGGNLMRLLEDRNKLPEDHVRMYTAQLVSVLKFVHNLDIAFRDLNVTNVMIDRHGYLRLVDWGFAKHIPDESMTFCGTPEYLAPEVIKREPHNKAVDTWSLGIVVFELLVGKTPFVEMPSGAKCTTLQLYRRIKEDAIECPPEMGPEAAAFITSLCRQDPKQRPAIAELVADPFLASIDWDGLKARTIEAPWVPPVQDDFDVSFASSLADEESSSESEEEGSGEEGMEEQSEEETEEERLERLGSNLYGVIFKPTVPPLKPVKKGATGEEASS